MAGPSVGRLGRGLALALLAVVFTTACQLNGSTSEDRTRSDLQERLDSLVLPSGWDLIEEREHVQPSQVLMGDDTLVLTRIYAIPLEREEAFDRLKDALDEHDVPYTTKDPWNQDGDKQVILRGSPLTFYVVRTGEVQMTTEAEF